MVLCLTTWVIHIFGVILFIVHCRLHRLNMTVLDKWIQKKCRHCNFGGLNRPVEKKVKKMNCNVHQIKHYGAYQNYTILFFFFFNVIWLIFAQKGQNIIQDSVVKHGTYLSKSLQTMCISTGISVRELEDLEQISWSSLPVFSANSSCAVLFFFITIHPTHKCMSV